MNNLTAEFFEDVEKIQNHSEDMEEALERLVGSELFSHVSTFYGDSWEELCFQASRMGKDIFYKNPEQYNELLRPAIFLVVCGLPQEEWNRIRTKDSWCIEYERRYDSATYVYLCNQIRREVERDLLDGVTLWQHNEREEEGWPAEVGDSTEPDVDAFVDEEVDVEEEALNNILLEQIHGMVNDEEWDIITSSHGDGPELAEKYGVTESAIRSRRQWVIERLRCELES